MANNSKPNLIKRTDFFNAETYSNVQISPDGKFISYIKNLRGAGNIYVKSISNQSNEFTVTNQNTNTVSDYKWSANSQFIIFFTDNNGDEKTVLHRASINENNTETKALTEHGKKSIPLAKSKTYPDEILVGSYLRNNQFYDVYKINIITGKSEFIYENHYFNKIGVDDDLNLVLGFFIQPDLEETVYNLTDLAKLVKLEPIKTKTIPVANYNNIFIEEKDLERSKELNFIKNKFDKTVEVVESSTSFDKNLSALAVISADNPIEYYLYDYVSSKLNFLFSSNSIMQDKTLAKMTPVIIEARDGLKLPCLLSLPNGIKIDPKDELSKVLTKPLPMDIISTWWSHRSF